MRKQFQVGDTLLCVSNYDHIHKTEPIIGNRYTVVENEISYYGNNTVVRVNGKFHGSYGHILQYVSATCFRHRNFNQAEIEIYEKIGGWLDADPQQGQST